MPKIGNLLVAACLLLSSIVFSGCSEMQGTAMKYPGKTMLVPKIDGDWWQIAGDPDLGEFTSEKQQPVDFGVWQAADGTWQLWSCIRKTKCGGHTRLFYRWEARNLTDANWEPKGIAMQAEPSLGEQPGGLQAPHVIKVDGTYYMFYGDWQRICLAKSKDGKNFTRVLNEKGQPDLFTGPWHQTRDAMVIIVDGKYYCYYTAWLREKKQFSKDCSGYCKYGAGFCRVSEDMLSWSKPYMVAFGGTAGNGPFKCECPHVVYREDLDLYYYFRTTRYGQKNTCYVYFSKDPLNFGIDDDRGFLEILPVAAPEIIQYQGQDYIAALLPSLKGIRMAKLKWEPLKK